MEKSRPSVLVYDIEIVNAIPDRDGIKKEGVEYCEGWGDHAGMGISVIGAYDAFEDRYRVFCEDNGNDFAALCAEREVLVGHNTIGFDNKVLAASGLEIDESKCYDIMRECAHGGSWGGLGLDKLTAANFGGGKSGSGADAPPAWQAGKIGWVIDYCLDDVRLTWRLVQKMAVDGWIEDPRRAGERIEVARPW